MFLVMVAVTIIIQVGMLYYEYYMACHGKLVRLEGTCVDKSEKSFPVFNESSNYILLVSEGVNYKCQLTRKQMSNIYVGSPITIYVYKSSIGINLDNMRCIYSPLYILMK